jgi:hypothetical protein
MGYINYYDDPVKKAVIKFYKKTFGIKLIINPSRYDIDLITPNKDLGVEVERSNAEGDYFSNNNYVFQSGLGHKTINIPSRKEWMWLPERVYRSKKNKNWKRVRQNPNWYKNVFVRTNKDFTQLIVIRPETITLGKFKMSNFYCENSNKFEDFMCFERKDVEVYNLVGDKFVMEKNKRSKRKK